MKFWTMGTDKTIRRILPGFLLLLLLSISCRKDFKPDEEITREKGASIRIKNFRRQSIKGDGHKEWILKAGEAYFFTNESKNTRIVVYDFELEQFDTKNKSLGVIRASHGTVDYEKKRISLEGGVVFTESPTKKIEGSSMSYNMDTKILTSDQPVTILEGGLLTRCKSGIVVEREKNRQICKQPSGYSEQPVQESEESFEGLFH